MDNAHAERLSRRWLAFQRGDIPLQLHDCLDRRLTHAGNIDGSPETSAAAVTTSPPSPSPTRSTPPPPTRCAPRSSPPPQPSSPSRSVRTTIGDEHATRVGLSARRSRALIDRIGGAQPAAATGLWRA